MGSSITGWCGNSVNTSEVSSVTKCSANSRLKKLKNILVSNKSNSASTEDLTEQATSEINTSHETCTNIQNNSIQKGNDIDSKLISQDDKCRSEPLSASISNISSHQLSSPIVSSTPVNIFKNLHKWVPNSDKSPKRSIDVTRNLANKRYLSLRKFINNSTIRSDPGEASQDSPLLGLKRSAINECMSDCSAPKKVALDSQLNTSQQSRSMKLLQSALCKENLNNKEMRLKNNDNLVGTSASTKRKVSNMLEDTKEIFSSDSKHRKKYCKDKDKTKQHIEESIKFSLCDNKPSTSSDSQLQSDDNYQEKMKMTGNWIASHCLMNNKKCNIFSDEPQIEELSVDHSCDEKKENSCTDGMEWTHVSIN